MFENFCHGGRHKTFILWVLTCTVIMAMTGDLKAEMSKEKKAAVAGGYVKLLDKDAISVLQGWP
ncbi:MAG: hypothetical protein JW943_05815 [Deltaproteobacteria bacterium]|nr:hypothetical protein [Deltaproteobacteria bacterium]